MPNKLIIIFFFITGTALGADDCNCTKPPINKLIDSDKIQNQFFNADKTKIIVNLKRPQTIESPRKVNWRSKDSVHKFHSKIKDYQNSVIKRFGSRIKMRNRFENQAGFSCEVTPEQLDQILADPNVESVEPVEIVQKHLAQGIPLMNAMVYRSTYNGQGVSIAICDCGVDYTHPMLGGEEGTFPNSKVIGGYDFGDYDTDPMPSSVSGSAHGTCCAGIAAGALGNVGDYIGGVAYNAKIYALKVENSSGLIYSDRIIAAWDWCVTHQYDDPCNPILVISTSLGSGGYTGNCDSSSPSYANSANAANAAGITLLASSGNDGYCTQIASPACLSGTISVGAVYDGSLGSYTYCVSSTTCNPAKVSDSGCSTGWHVTDSTHSDMVTCYSNISSSLDILAPSTDAYTTDIAGANGFSSGDYYSSFGGTSAASPYAAGAVACLQSASKSINGVFLTPAQVREILTSTGDSLTDTKTPITKPRINLGNAIDSLGLYTPSCTEIQLPIIGEDSTLTYPLRTKSDDSRTQVIYLASEIGRAGKITNLSIEVNDLPYQSLNNFTIRMKHTSLTSYSINALESTDWTTVYQANETISSTGLHTFEFQKTFNYNGTDNLMVDFSHNNSSHSVGSGTVHCKFVSDNRLLFAFSNSTNGDPLDWSGSSNPSVSASIKVPYIRLNICCDVGSADFQPDCHIDFLDLAVLTGQWLSSGGTPSADIAPAPNGDNNVNLLDFAEFAAQWINQNN